jgi:hypothetical protein
MDSGTYMFTTESTVQDRDQAINTLIDNYDSKKNPQSNTAKAKAKAKSTTSVAFIFIAEAFLLGFILLILLLELEIYKLSWYSVVTLIGLYGTLLLFNVIMFISIRTPEELNMARLTIETSKMFPIVFVVFAVLFAVPQFNLVFENTVGYGWLSFVKSSLLTDTMNTLKSNLFQKNPFSGLVIPFNWLITTFNVDNFEDTINQIPKGPFVSEKSGDNPVSEKSDYIDFYLPEEADFEVFKKNLLKMVKTKRKVGHFVWIYMALISASLLSTLETIK